MVNAQKNASGVLPTNFFSVPLAANFYGRQPASFDITTLAGYKQFRLRQAYNTSFGDLYQRGGLQPSWGRWHGPSASRQSYTAKAKVGDRAVQSPDFVRFQMGNDVTISWKNSISVVMERISNITHSIGGTCAG